MLGTAIALFVCYSFFTFPTLHCAEYVSMKIVSSFLPPCVVNLGFFLQFLQWRSINSK